MRIAAIAALAALTFGPTFVADAAAQGALPTSARVRGGAAAPLAPPLTIGGGEVILDVTVGKDGAVTKVQPVRSTPPYTELLATAVGDWRFDPPKSMVEGELQPGDGHVLVVAVYRPPQVYAAPARGEETKTVADLSPELPAPVSLTMPASYPPRATRDGAVVVELELSMAGMVRNTKVIGRPSAFDSAALDTVRTWRFDIPREPAGAEQVFVYAVVGFREPITQ